MKSFKLSAALLTLFVIGEAQAQYSPQGYGASPEQLVGQWYRQFLRRAPDPTAGYWIDSLRQGTPPEQVLSLILASGEYFIQAGGDDHAWVRRAIQDLSGRSPGQQEVYHWMGQLRTRDRNAVAYDLVSRYWGGGYGGGYSQPYEYQEPPYDYRRPSRHYQRPFDRFRR